MAFTADLKCYKLLLVLIDFFFFFGGIALIGVGAWSLTSYVEGVGGQNLAIAIIVVGCLITILALIGCCGALRESRGLLKCYTSLVIALAIVVYVYSDSIPDRAYDSWVGLSDNAKSDIEVLFECCGWSNYTDHPSTVCNTTGATDGCENAIVQSIEDNLRALGLTAIIIGSLELIVVLFSCCLIYRIPTKAELEQALLEEARRLNRDQPQHTSYGAQPSYVYK